jgi:hypothetical protein
MAEKRKLPPRAGREPAAKRRVSEAVTPQSKKKAPTPRVPSPPSEPVEAPLPSKLREGEPLPVRRVRQPDSLSETEYQSIAERFDPSNPCRLVKCSPCLIIQRSITRVTRTIQKEVAKRRHPGSILYEAEEDETRADREEQPAEGLHGKGWTLRRHRRPSLFRRHAVHCQRPQCAAATASICASAPDDALQRPEQLSAIPAVSISEPTTPSLSPRSGRPSSTRLPDASTTWFTSITACAVSIGAAATAERPVWPACEAEPRSSHSDACYESCSGSRAQGVDASRCVQSGLARAAPRFPGSH